MNEDFYISLIQKQLSNELPPEEEQALKRWEESSEANQQFAEEIRKAWELGGKYADPPSVSLDLDTEFGLLEKRIKETEGTEAPVRSLRRLPMWSRIAAVIVLLVGVGFLLRTVLNPDAQWQEIETMAQASQLLELPDGSKVRVNANSQFRYPANFDSEQRMVYLEGQAFFEVEHQAGKAFIVRTPTATIEVLGTSFDVKDSKADEVVTVQVVEGKVQVSSKASQSLAVLTANQQLRFNKTDMLPKVDTSASPNPMSWHTGVLVFDDAPLKEVVATLEDFYQVEIELESTEMINCPINVKREKETAKELLEIIGDIFGMQVSETAPKKFLLEGGSCE